MSVRKNGKIIAGTAVFPCLFDFKWADHILNDVSWLRADTFSWQDGGVYEAAYEHLVDDVSGLVFYRWGLDGQYYTTKRQPSYGDAVYTDAGVTQFGTIGYYQASVDKIAINASGGYVVENVIYYGVVYPNSETISGTTIGFVHAADGHKIVLSDQEGNVGAIYNSTGVAWYYILDTTNERFKLPRTKFGFAGIRSGVGSYIEAGVPNITGGFKATINQLAGATGAFASTNGSCNTAYANSVSSPSNFSFDASRSSSVYGNSDTVQPRATEMYLYFYVGNFTQTAIENTAGLNAELFNDKVDVGHEVIAFQAPTAGNNYTWYRKYADGWVEQGGNVSTSSDSAYNVVLPVTMANDKYTALITRDNGSQDHGSGTINARWCEVWSRTTTSFYTWGKYGDATDFSWQVSGMAA